MADLNQDVFFSTIVELNRRLRARELSAFELTRAFLDRLERLGSRYNALALLLSDKALAKARAVDDEIKRGRLRGPLQGVPCGVKDLLSVAGKPTAWGARPYAGQVFDYDATVVRKLDRAGAVAAAKLAMVELAGAGGYRLASASLNGATRNPWNPERWAGGSSSGPAAAVAAGLVPFAIGSETLGSIVTPCAFSGVTGLRPTYGLVSRHGAMPLAWTMDKIGPICRSAEDCGHVLQAISGGDANDPSSAGKSFYYTPQFARKLTDLKAGFAPADFNDNLPEPLRPAFGAALIAFRDLGLQMVEIGLPDFPYDEVAQIIIAAEGSAVFEPLIKSGAVEQLADERQIEGLKAGLEIPARDYLRAMRIRSLIRQQMRQLFSKVDLVVAPAAFRTATQLDEPLDRAGTGLPQGSGRSLAALTAAGNLAGLPALVLPCGFSEGLPVALQLVGRAFTENTLLAAGVAFQQRTDFHRRRPPT